MLGPQFFDPADMSLRRLLLRLLLLDGWQPGHSQPGTDDIVIVHPKKARSVCERKIEKF